MAIIKTISDLLWGMPLIVLILLAGIIFTVGSKFFQIAHLKHILKNTIGTLFSKKDNGKGMMKPLEVISIAVGGAVGVGNIGGVATAIAVGGPGAAFWIWVAAFLGMMMLQVFVAIIPGEPLEIGAGYAFGILEGTLLCVLGTTLSSIAIFLFVKKFGMRFVTLFIAEEKIHSLKFLQNARRLNLIAFILFFIPILFLTYPRSTMSLVTGLSWPTV